MSKDTWQNCIRNSNCNFIMQNHRQRQVLYFLCKSRINWFQLLIKTFSISASCDDNPLQCGKWSNLLFTFVTRSSPPCLYCRRVNIRPGDWWTVLQTDSYWLWSVVLHTCFKWRNDQLLANDGLRVVIAPSMSRCCYVIKIPLENPTHLNKSEKQKIQRIAIIIDMHVFNNLMYLMCICIYTAK